MQWALGLMTTLKSKQEKIAKESLSVQGLKENENQLNNLRIFQMTK